MRPWLARPWDMIGAALFSVGGLTAAVNTRSWVQQLLIVGLLIGLFTLFVWVGLTSTSRTEQTVRIGEFWTVFLAAVVTLWIVHLDSNVRDVHCHGHGRQTESFLVILIVCAIGFLSGLATAVAARIWQMRRVPRAAGKAPASMMGRASSRSRVTSSWVASPPISRGSGQQAGAGTIRARMASRTSRGKERTVRADHWLRGWAEITELCLALRGSTLLGARGARSWRECVRAGLADANRRRAREQGG